MLKFLEFYYSLLGPSSVWSESSSSRTKKFEYESSIEYSQGPGPDPEGYIGSGRWVGQVGRSVRYVRLVR